eukprot:TRINITY_DN2144_c0_g3_i1.p1 TRINITY_DN2144_c0_g3~~TRINITY_DN2144_c0_g3_i1.p1  ORF type:complete len:738 (-),score=125.59 TRINITY_DN2144_c0_g3_i1:51-2264(-)
MDVHSLIVEMNEKNTTKRSRESEDDESPNEGSSLEKHHKKQRVLTKIWVSVEEVISSVTLDSNYYPDPTVDDLKQAILDTFYIGAGATKKNQFDLKWDPVPENLSEPLPETYSGCKDGNLLDSLATLKELGMNEVNTNSRRGGSPVFVVMKSDKSTYHESQSGYWDFKSVMSNGIEIDPRIFVFHPRGDVVKKIDHIIKSEVSTGGAIWLLGHYGSGKTNILKIVRDTYSDWKTVRINFDGKKKDYLTVENVMYVLSKEMYPDAPSKWERNVFDPYENPDEEFPKVLITFDETQLLIENAGEEDFYNLVRSISRFRPFVYILCASSDFTVLGPLITDPNDLKSPFVFRVQLATFFSREDILFLVRDLFFGMQDDVLLKDFFDEFIEFSWYLTEGHPGLIGVLLGKAYDVLCSNRNNLENLHENWKRDKHKVYEAIDICRYSKRITDIIQMDRDFINQELFHLLNNGEQIDYDPLDTDMNNLLRSGLALLKLGKDHMTNRDLIVQSCRGIERVYFASSRRVLTPISQFLEPDYLHLDLQEVVLYLIDNMSLDNINRQKTYWRKKGGSYLFPSEASYRTEFYSMLADMCRNSRFIATFEEPIPVKKAKAVDLCIIDKENVLFYQIELAANIQVKGPKHSYESHYIRQRHTYRQLEGTYHSAVVCIINDPDQFIFKKDNMDEIRWEKTIKKMYWPPKSCFVRDVTQYYVFQTMIKDEGNLKVQMPSKIAWNNKENELEEL